MTVAKDNKITQIRKRDDRIALFEESKITKAILAALAATQEIESEKKRQKKATEITAGVIKTLNKKFHVRSIPAVEELQDIVEEELSKAKLFKTAKSYILYRDQRAKVRDMQTLINSDELIDGYLNQLDWRVKENSNMSFSLQGLNNHVASAVSSHYWLHRIYPPEVREAHLNGDMHLHDLQLLSAYCCGWDLKDLLLLGFGGVSGKIESKPAKHFRVALGQLVNFFYTLQGETAGAQAISSFDTLLAPFIRFDKLTYNDVKQSIQEFLYNMNVPTRVGFQTPFTNITMDLSPGKYMADEGVIIGGVARKETYKEFQTEVDMINRAFAEVMLEGDSKGRVFTFPIPTYNITKDFNWDNPVLEPLWEMTAKYGVPYFSNFINSDMKPEDARSMCCRLRLDNRELRKKGGGLFGANPLTGSIGVVTIDLPRVGYLSKSKEEWQNRLTRLMDIAKTSLEIKRQAIEKFTEQGLYPYSRFYLSVIKERFGYYWKNHFNTIGINGMNEMALNFLGADKNLATVEGQEFALEILDFMRERLGLYQEETGNLYNLEATPAEGTAYRFARKDKEVYPAIICANEEAWRKGKADPYYTNSSHLPVGSTDDIFEALKLQDNLQTRYTGGTVLHGFIGERMPNGEATKQLIKKIAENFHLPYYTITPTFSICPKHGYITGEHHFCPRCDEEIGYTENTKQKTLKLNN